jgi:S-layer protein (TIGR01567 family)
LVALVVLCTPAFGQTATTIFDSWNKGVVDSNPTCSPSFTISEPQMITYIDTYHWNSGQGTSSGGTISLKKDDGKIFGPWTAKAESGSGVPNVWWISHPNVVIPAGTYTIIDSEPTTWSKNSGSNNCGFSKVEGYPYSSVKINSGIAYTTHAQFKNFKFKPWGQYDVVEFLGDNYFASYDPTVTADVANAGESAAFLYKYSRNRNLTANEQISKVLIDNKNETTITSEKPLKLEEGYQLAIASIQTNGKGAFLELSKNGQVVDSKVVQPEIDNAQMGDKTYYYKTQLGATIDIIQIAVHFKNAFRAADTNIATVDGVFQISDTITPLVPSTTATTTTSKSTVGPVMRGTESTSVMIGSDQITIPDRSSLIQTSDWGEVPANQVMVMLKEGNGQTEADRLASSLGGKVVGFFNYINLYQIETSGTTETELKDSVAKAEQDPDVELAFPNQQSYPDATVQGTQCSPLDDPVYTEGGRGKDYEMIGVQRAWDLIRVSGLPLSNTHVGVVDDGLYKENDEFNGKVKITTNEPNSELQNSLGKIYDDHGNLIHDYTVLGSHGTGVVNIIAANPDNGGITGIASQPLGDKLEVSMINQYAPPYGNHPESTPDPDDPTKTVKSDGKTYTISGLLAINKSINSGAKIISCSWGNSNANLNTAAAYKKFFEKMAKNHPDVLFVCSAGNDGTALDGSHRFPSGLALPNMVTVGNVMNDGTKAGTSNMASNNFEVTIAAPGSESIHGFDNKGGIVNDRGGTSMATPQVTSAAALIRALNPQLTAGEIKDTLVQNARTSVDIDGKKVSAPPELGGRILAIDQAVFKVINDQRKKLGLELFQDIDYALGSARIDLVAENDPVSLNDWKVTAKLLGVGANGADVKLELQGEGAVGGNTKHLTKSGSLTWSVTTKDSASIVVKRLDTNGCSKADLVVPAETPGDAQAWWDKGVALYYAGKYDEAIKAYDEAIRLDSNYANAYYYKALALKALGKTDDADAAYAKAKELDYDTYGNVPLGA